MFVQNVSQNARAVLTGSCRSVGGSERVGAVEQLHGGAGEPVAVPELHHGERERAVALVLLAARDRCPGGAAVPLPGAQRQRVLDRDRRQPDARPRPPRRLQHPDPAPQQVQQ